LRREECRAFQEPSGDRTRRVPVPAPTLHADGDKNMAKRAGGSRSAHSAKVLDEIDEMGVRLLEYEKRRLALLKEGENPGHVERRTAIGALLAAQAVFNKRGFAIYTFVRLVMALEAVDDGEMAPEIFKTRRRSGAPATKLIGRMKGALAAAVYQRMHVRGMRADEAARNVAKAVPKQVALRIWRRAKVDQKTLHSLYREFASPRKPGSYGHRQYQDLVKIIDNHLDHIGKGGHGELGDVLMTAVSLNENLPRDFAE